jgi:ribosomal protein S20
VIKNMGGEMAAADEHGGEEENEEEEDENPKSKIKTICKNFCSAI